MKVSYVPVKGLSQSVCSISVGSFLVPTRQILKVNCLPITNKGFKRPVNQSQSLSTYYSGGRVGKNSKRDKK